MGHRVRRANGGEKISLARRALMVPVHALIGLLVRRDWRRVRAIPAAGPVIFCPNHISDADFVMIGEFLIYNGRWPHFLAKRELFSIPLFGWLIRGLGQIQVDRGEATARNALVAAEAALRQGKAVVVYPEGTITYDPGEWPMAGHVGAARLALATGAPVIPIGQWGANDLRAGRVDRPRSSPVRPTVRICCGDPVDLSAFGTDAFDRICLQAATVAIMDALTMVVAELREEPAPHTRWHPWRTMHVPPGEATL